MNYLRAGLQRSQSNRTATHSNWFDTVEFTGFKIGQDSAGDAELTIALLPTAGERVLIFTCDHNGLQVQSSLRASRYTPLCDLYVSVVISGLTIKFLGVSNSLPTDSFPISSVSCPGSAMTLEFMSLVILNLKACALNVILGPLCLKPVFQLPFLVKWAYIVNRNKMLINSYLN